MTNNDVLRANDPDDVDHMPMPWWACPVLGVLIAAAAVLAGSVGRHNRLGGRRG